MLMHNGVKLQQSSQRHNSERGKKSPNCGTNLGGAIAVAAYHAGHGVYFPGKYPFGTPTRPFILPRTLLLPGFTPKNLYLTA